MLVLALGLGSSGIYFTQKSPNEFLVTRIVDGDTIELKNGQVVRYIGLDTPEKEKCFFEESSKINEALVLDKKIRLEFDQNEMDRFGRTLAYVFITNPETNKEIFVNEYLLQKGAGKFFLDTVNLRYQDQLATSAQKAHEEKQGLWQTCAPDPNKGCLIKGNLDKLDNRYYHLPEFRHYDQVVINLISSDQWFCTEKEAIEAGFTKARE